MTSLNALHRTNFFSLLSYSAQREENICRPPLFGADWPIRRDHTGCCWHNLALWPTVNIGRVEVASGGNAEEENTHNEDNQRGDQRHQFLLSVPFRKTQLLESAGR